MQILPSILIADPDDSFRALMRDLLCDSADISESVDGDAAYQFLLNHPQTVLMLMDADLRLSDGTPLLPAVRTVSGLSPAVIACSSNVDDTLCQTAIESGAADCFPKNIPRAIAHRRIQNVLNSHLSFDASTQPSFDGKEKAFVEIDNRLQALINAVPGGIITCEMGAPSLKLLYYNDAACELLGYTRQEYARLADTDLLQAIYPKDIDDVRNQIRFFCDHRQNVSFSFRVLNKRGEIRWLCLSASPLISPDGRLLCCAVLNDVSLQKENELRIEQALHEMEFRSEHDLLTGISNRESFNRLTAQMLQQRSETPHVLLAINIQRFKVVNEMLGTELGDIVLRTIGTTLHRLFHKLGTVARLEADHFSACIPRDELDIEAIDSALQKAIRPLNTQYHIILSYGIYQIHSIHIPVEKMCDRAAMAQRTIKGSAVKRYAYYDDDMRRQMLEEQFIIEEMHDALQKGQFVPFFQPIYSLTTRRPVSAEVLVRWLHPVRGMIPPAKFIPLFERNGFITKLDTVVWDQACALLASWRRKGLDVLPLSINISRVDLYHPRLCEDLLNLLERYGLEPSLLKLEITESAYTDDPETLAAILTRFRSAGFHILMDDFGSGYSSLNTLKDMPVNILKIDMRFLDKLENSPRAASILTSVVRMAKWLSMPVVAEGVETKEQFDFLHSVGCDDAQGFYFAKPMPADDYEKLLADGAGSFCMDSSPVENAVDLDALWNSSRELTLLFNSLIGGMVMYEWIGDMLEIRRVNDAYYRVLGCTSQQVFGDGRNALDSLHPEDRPLLMEKCQACMTGKQIERVTVRHRNGNGHMIWLEIKLRHVATTGANPIFICIVSDVTETKEAEQNRSLEKYTLALRSMFGRIFEMNFTRDRFRDLYRTDGEPNTEMYTIAQGREHFARRIHPEDLPLFGQTFDPAYLQQRIEESGKLGFTVEQRMMDDSGSYSWYARTFLKLDHLDGDTVYLLCTSNITPRKQYELLAAENRVLQVKQQEQQLYRRLMEYIGTILIEWDCASQTLSHSPGYEQLACSRFSIASIAHGSHLNDIAHPDDVPALRVFLRNAIDLNLNQSVSVRLLNTDGQPCLCRVDVFSPKAPDGSLFRRVAAIRRIEDQAVLPEDLLSPPTFETIADSLLVGLCIVEYAGGQWKPTFLSNGYRSLMGYGIESCVTLTAEEQTVFADVAQKLTDTGKPITVEYRAPHQNGSSLWLRAHAACISAKGDPAPRIYIVMADITESKVEQEYLPSLMNKIPVAIGIYELDHPYRRTYGNQALACLFESSHPQWDAHCNDDPIIRHLYALSPEQKEAFSLAVKSPYSIREVFLFRRKDGNPVWIHLQIYVFGADTGIPVCFISAAPGEDPSIACQPRLPGEEESRQLLLAHMDSLTFEYDVTADALTLYFRSKGIAPYKRQIPNHLAALENSPLIPVRFQPLYRDAFARLCRCACADELECPACFDGGERRWRRFQMMSTAGDDGQVTRIVGRIADISHEKQLEEQLSWEQQYRKALMAETLFMFEVNLITYRAELLHSAKTATKAFYPGLNYVNLLRSTPYIHPEDLARVRAAFTPSRLRALYRRYEAESAVQTRILNTRGQWVWVECTFHLLEGERMDMPRLLLHIRVVDSQKRIENELRKRADTDPVSGVYNRRAMQEHVARLLPDSVSRVDGFFLLDIDWFKQINDTFGHAVGDDVIRRISNRLRGVLRSTDLIGRLGGDEFMLYIKGISPEDARVKATHVLDSVRELSGSFPEGLSLSASIGISLSPIHGFDFETLYRNADQALYQAKKQGKNCFSVYDPAIDPEKG